MEREKFLSSIYLIIKNENGEVLLQRRQGTKLWPGYLALPAGHIDEGENAYDAAIREAREELGIEITIDDIVDTFVVNRKNKSLTFILKTEIKGDYYYAKKKIIICSCYSGFTFCLCLWHSNNCRTKTIQQ